MFGFLKQIFHFFGIGTSNVKSSTPDQKSRLPAQSVYASAPKVNLHFISSNNCMHTFRLSPFSSSPPTPMSLQCAPAR